MNNTTQRVVAGLLLATLFAACSRPVAYFQKSVREQLATSASTPALPAPGPETTGFVGNKVVEPVTVAFADQIEQARAALGQLESVVRNDRKLSADRAVEKRLHRMRTLLTPALATVRPASVGAVASKKANLMEQMMLRKVNRNINKHLAPANPNKPMISTGILAVGAVVAIVGLILLLVGGSSSAGVILLLAGAVVLLLGLLL